ncbi:hypothetical protein JCM11641_001368 [Rhodosporidiobolus odoratus]
MPAAPNLSPFSSHSAPPHPGYAFDQDLISPVVAASITSSALLPNPSNSEVLLSSVLPSPSGPPDPAPDSLHLLSETLPQSGTDESDGKQAVRVIETEDPPRSLPPSPCSSSPSKQKVRKNGRKKKKVPEPQVASRPLTTKGSIRDTPAVLLIDSGSQADVISSALAHRLGLEFHRLLASLHAQLRAEGHDIRLGIYTEVDVKVGTSPSSRRSFFVAPLPEGIDAILGVPWLKDTNYAVSSSHVFIVPSGPREDVVDCDTGRYHLQPEANFDNLGFVSVPMTDDESHRFVVCAIAAGVEGLGDFVDVEPPNPLLAELDDDPSKEDLSESEAQARLSSLLDQFADVLVSKLPSRFPPLRPVNGRIDLKDEELKVKPRPIGIPARYQQQWRAHVLKFVETGYWSPAALDSACSMFAVPKHDPSQARFVINLEPRNANTLKRISPIPDMKGVRSNVASAKRRTKLDFKAAYEQIRLEPESVPLSGFVTPTGTYVSRVLQQGDTNAPDTMHRVCNLMFAKLLGRGVDVFYDDVFVYSQTYRAHLVLLEIVLTTLCHYRFYLSRDKVDFFASRLEALGSIITDDGIEVDPKKWDAVRKWPVPRNVKDVLRFMGTVQWMSDHLPRLSEIAAPITRLTGKVDWCWSPACEAAFDMIKSLVPQTLSPLDIGKLESGVEKLFVFSDASILRCGGWIGQGTTIER